MNDIVEIAANIPLSKTFYYQVPEPLGVLPPGSRVVVPMGNRKVHGFILSSVNSDKASGVPAKLKSIESVECAYQLPEEKMSFYQWAARYYQYPLGKLLHEAIPLFWGRPFEVKRRKKKEAATRMSHAKTQHEIVLTSEQELAVKKIVPSILSGGFSAFLLDGVTGSGKTEVYFTALSTCLGAKKSALYLVPEINLTPQLLDRFYGFFQQNGLVYHSQLTPRQREETTHTLFDRMRTKEPFVLIGTRSALLLPIDIDFLVVDEEHDPSYKQNDHFHYNARDLALLRAKHFSIPIVLGSATPSIESHHACQTGKITKLTLTQRPQEIQLPSVQLIDLKIEKPDASLLTPTVIREIGKNLEAGEQSILFLNRRGFSPHLFCTSCGTIFRCRNCEISLTFSKHRNCLRCHYCGMENTTPKECSQCHGSELIALGSGTERVEDRLHELFPNATIARFDRDTVSSPRKLNEMIQSLHEGKTQILVGTQMISKGHDFPNVTLVAVLCADAHLHFPDFRASERTFQLLTQVSGRAGRSQKPGRVFVQTFQPDHPVLTAIVNGTRDAFIAEELKIRHDHKYPPFYRLALVRFQSRNEATLKNWAYSLRQSLPENEGVECLGPVMSPLSKIDNQFRMQLLLKSSNWTTLNQFIRNRVMGSLQRTKGIQAFVDVDPQQLL